MTIRRGWILEAAGSSLVHLGAASVIAGSFTFERSSFVLGLLFLFAITFVRFFLLPNAGPSALFAGAGIAISVWFYLVALIGVTVSDPLQQLGTLQVLLFAARDMFAPDTFAVAWLGVFIVVPGVGALLCARLVRLFMTGVSRAG